MGINLECDYAKVHTKKSCRLTINGYIQDVCIKYGHPNPKNCNYHRTCINPLDMVPNNNTLLTKIPALDSTTKVSSEFKVLCERSCMWDMQLITRY